MRVTRHDVDRTLQVGLVPFYAIMTLAGLAIIAFAPPSLLEVLGPIQARVSGVFLLLGGSICFGGVLVTRGKDNDWLGEYAGLPGIITALVSYATVAALTVGSVPGRTGGVLIFYGFIVLLYVRWLRVRDDAGMPAPWWHHPIRTARKVVDHPPRSAST